MNAMLLDLVAIGRRAQQAIDTPFVVDDGAGRDHRTAFVIDGPTDVLALLVVLRNIVDSIAEAYQRFGLPTTKAEQAVEELWKAVKEMPEISGHLKNLPKEDRT